MRDGGDGGGTLAASVGEALRGAILSGRFKAGDKLPSEAKLTLEHGVSRTVIREAIAALRADGLVVPRQGAGVFVLAPPPRPALPFRDIDTARVSSLIEVLELRTPVEVESAGLAAQRRSAVQEEAIVARHRELVADAEAGRPTVGADFDFHLAIASATNNPRFVEFLRLLGDGAIPRSALHGPAGEIVDVRYLLQVAAEHRSIVDAIVSGNARDARSAMKAHLVGSQQRYRALIR